MAKWGENRMVEGDVKGYRLLEKIGQGGFGAVYKAHQIAVGREVAVKVILPEFANQPEFIRRFENEAQLVARLEHPFIVPLFDYWREPDRAYLVMRFFPQSLYDRLQTKGKMSLEKASQLLEQIAGALTVAHRNRVIHRDIKPQNIMLDDDENGYLTDFGIASHLSHDGQPEDEKLSFTGSPAYASPEIIMGMPTTPQSDIYSLGYVIHRVLTGEPVIHDPTVTRWLAHHLNEALPPLEEMPPQVTQVLQQATAKSAENRYESVLDMAIAFRNALQGRSAKISGEDIDKVTTVYKIQVNPYKGLRAFEESDAADFFGRETLVQGLLQRLAEDHVASRFLAVVGPSGSGKSSVVKAGLIPALRRGALPHSDEWFFADMTPGINPLEKLATTLLSVAVNPPSRLWEQLTTNSRGLLEVTEAILPTGAQLVLVIDQFEEIFTLVEYEAERTLLMDALRIATTDPQSRLRVIITLRADFYDRPLLYDRFADLMRQRTEVVIPLNSDELERAIVSPAERVGLKVDSKLIAAIISDLREEPGTLPLLQYALTEVFERREGHILNVESYQASGGALGALARRAEELYSNLPNDQQIIARQLLLRLVTLGEGKEDTRRRVLLSELQSIVSDENNLNAILDLFGKYRLFTFDHDPQTREPSIEVAHEALIREWGRLREWLGESRQDVRQERLLAAATAEWQAANQEKSFLLRGARLSQFEDWQASSSIDLTKDERVYLDASLEERQTQEQAEQQRQAQELALEQRARQRLQWIIGLLLVASVIGIALTLAIFRQSRNAQEERDNAQVARDEAINARATSDANLALAERSVQETQSIALASIAQQAFIQNNPDLAVSLAVQANQIDNPPDQAQQILLSAAALPGTRHLLTGHTNTIWADAISPDGRYGLSGSGGFSPGSNFYQDLPTYLPINTAPMPVDNSIRLWDLKTGQEIRQFNGHENTVSDLVFSSDGNTFFSTSADGTIRQWDVTTGEELKQFSGTGFPILSIDLSPDGSQVLTSDYDFDTTTSHLVLWDATSGAEIRRFEGQRDVIFSVDISPDGQLVLSTSGPSGPFSPGSGNNDIVIWDLATGEVLSTLVGHQDVVFKALFLPDSRRVLSSSGDSSLKLWDAITGELLNTLQGHTSFVYSIALSPDGKLAMSSGFDSAQILWDLERGEELRRFYGHRGFAADIAFAPDGREVLTGSDDFTLRLWDIFSPDNQERLTVPAGQGMWAVAVSPDQKTVLTSSGSPGLFAPYTGDYTLHLWDIETGQEIRQFSGHRDNIFDVVFLADGKRFLSSSGNAFLPGGDNVMILWDIETGEEIRRFTPDGIGVTGIAVTPDSQQAVTISFGTHLTLWDIETGQEIRRFDGSPISWDAVAISPDGQTMVSGGADGSVTFWNLETGEQLHQEIAHSSLVNQINYSPDGNYVLSASDDSVVMVWDTTSMTQLYAYRGHNTNASAVAVSPDSQRVLSADYAGQLLLWDIATGKTLNRWQENRSLIYDLTFVDANHAVTSSYDGSLILWDVTPHPLEAVIEWVEANRYVRDLTCDEQKLYRINEECLP